MPATATDVSIDIVARPAAWDAAVRGPKSQASAWNFVAAGAALAMGLEARSVLGTISGLGWIISQSEAWVDELKVVPGAVAGAEGRPINWAPVAGVLLVAISGFRTVKKGDLKNWRWV